MLIEDLNERNIAISPRVFELNDLATGWEVAAIVENPDVFENFYIKYPLERVNSFEDYYLFLLSLKLQSLSNVLPVLIHGEHKAKIVALSNAATETLKSLNRSSVISYINGHIKEIFNTQYQKRDIRFVTVNLIAQYNNGINKDVFQFLCEQHAYLLIDRYADFEKVFEKESDLFEHLLPSGRLDNIDPYWLGKILDIFRYILNKDKSNLKDIVENRVSALIDDAIQLVKEATVESIFQVEGVSRKIDSFLKNIRSSRAHEFSQYAREANNLLLKHMAEYGQTISYDISVGKILEKWKETSNWLIRLLSLTHDCDEKAGQTDFISRLSKTTPSEFSLLDFVSTNIATDEYFTVGRQEKLSISSNIGTVTLLGILADQEMEKDYLCLLASALNIVSKGLNVQEELKQDTSTLLSMIHMMTNSFEADKNTFQALCYGVSMYICAFSEKLLRLLYIKLTNGIRYVSNHEITLGGLMDDGNNEIKNIFGEDHMRSLYFFLMQAKPNSIGKNIRNSLAHWSDISSDSLTNTFFARVLWLFTDILNTVLWYLIKDTINGDQMYDQL